jgi:hypothetical protein
MLSAAGTPEAFGGDGGVVTGKRLPLLEADGVLHGELRGAGEAIAFQIYGAETSPRLEIQGWAYALRECEQTDWISLKFGSTRAIVRFMPLRTGENFELYCTPLQIDPEHPAQPISHPAWYATYFARMLGPYWTLGATGDLAAFHSGILGPGEFHAQVRSILSEREAIFFNAVEHLENGVVGGRFEVEHDPEFATTLMRRLVELAQRGTALLVELDSGIFSSATTDGEVAGLGSALKWLFGIEGSR